MKMEKTSVNMIFQISVAAYKNLLLLFIYWFYKI